MSLSRLGPGAHITIILGFVFPAMIASALALAYNAWRDVADVSSALEAQVRQTAAVQARDTIDGIEKRLNESAHEFFTRLAANLSDPAVTEKCAIDLPPIVSAFVIYNDDPAKAAWDCRTPALPASNANRRGRKEEPDPLIADMAALRKWFVWDEVEPNSPKYVHGPSPSRNGSLLLVLADLPGIGDRRHHMVARLDLDFIRSNFVELGLRKLGETFRVAVIDETGNALKELIFGGPEPKADERFLYEQPFGKALWAWKLRQAPREVDIVTQQARVERQRVLRLSLIALSTSIIAVGLGIVFLAVIAERRTSALKSDFIANVSHELKTPLSLIRMFGEMVATGRHKGEGTAREYGGIITREAERLGHLIDNVLDFARLERGKTSYRFQEGDVAAVLDRALEVCRYRLDKDKLRLKVDVDRELPVVRMDEDAVTLVILNLVDNAVKYAAEGGEVHVGLARAPGGVALTVRDFGPGVPKDDQRRIFERFYRAESARQRNVRGSGIGLSLVEHIVEAHGGHVTVESPAPPVVGEPSAAAGPGTLFRVFLPAPVVSAPPAAQDPSA